MRAPARPARARPTAARVERSRSVREYLLDEGTTCTARVPADEPTDPQLENNTSATARHISGKPQVGNHEPGSTRPRRPGIRRRPRCIAHQHALSRCSRPPTAPRRPRSTGITAPSAGARPLPRSRTVSPTTLPTNHFRATSRTARRYPAVTQSGRATQVEPEPVLVNKANGPEGVGPRPVRYREERRHGASDSGFRSAGSRRRVAVEGIARDLDTAGADAGHADPVAAAQGGMGCGAQVGRVPGRRVRRPGPGGAVVAARHADGCRVPGGDRRGRAFSGAVALSSGSCWCSSAPLMGSLATATGVVLSPERAVGWR